LQILRDAPSKLRSAREFDPGNERAIFQPRAAGYDAAELRANAARPVVAIEHRSALIEPRETNRLRAHVEDLIELAIPIPPANAHAGRDDRIDLARIRIEARRRSETTPARTNGAAEKTHPGG
jgi:hypothetical protein